MRSSSPSVLPTTGDANRTAQDRSSNVTSLTRFATNQRQNCAKTRTFGQPWAFAYPASKQIIVPTLVVNRANVEDFTKRINELRGR